VDLREICWVDERGLGLLGHFSCLLLCCLQMQMWAESKQQPGQFTGSTGARVLSAAELASGYQAWAKKVQQALRPLTNCVFWHFHCWYIALLLCVCVCVCVCARACVRVCVRARGCMN
jgi:hypothetical protein